MRAVLVGGTMGSAMTAVAKGSTEIDKAIVGLPHAYIVLHCHGSNFLRKAKSASHEGFTAFNRSRNHVRIEIDS